MTPGQVSDRRSGQDRRANPRYQIHDNPDPYFCDRCGVEFELLSQLLTHRSNCRGKQAC